MDYEVQEGGVQSLKYTKRLLISINDNNTKGKSAIDTSARQNEVYTSTLVSRRIFYEDFYEIFFRMFIIWVQFR